MKQTAVDYLIEQLQAPCRGIPSHIIEKAKEIEKEQIIDDYFQGVCDESDSHGAQSLDMKDAEKYYNAKYGK